MENGVGEERGLALTIDNIPKMNSRIVPQRAFTRQNGSPSLRADPEASELSGQLLPVRLLDHRVSGPAR